MKALVYDSETTGLPIWSAPSADSRQPHIVQIAALLVDLDTWRTLAGIDLIISPSSYEPRPYVIPDDVAAIHGITTEHAEAVGVPAHTALAAFFSLWRRADVRVAHNESFDARMFRIACHRHGDLVNIPHPDTWQAGLAECTQRLATPILHLPPTVKMVQAGFNKPKSANLREAYQHFTGAPLPDAHSAMGDVLGCLAVYKAIKAARAPNPEG